MVQHVLLKSAILVAFGSLPSVISHRLQALESGLLGLIFPASYTALSFLASEESQANNLRLRRGSWLGACF